MSKRVFPLCPVVRRVVSCALNAVAVALRRLDPLPVINLCGARGQIALSCKSTDWHVFIAKHQHILQTVCVCVWVCVRALVPAWAVSRIQG